MKGRVVLWESRVTETEERIRYRKQTINKLLKAIRNSTDIEFRERAHLTIEEKKREIEDILAEAAKRPTPPETNR